VESAKGGRAKFAVTGDVTGAWINGQPVKLAAGFTTNLRAGTNTVVLELKDETPGAVRLSSDDVSFVAK